MEAAVIAISVFAWLICGGWSLFVISEDESTKPEHAGAVVSLCLFFAPFAFGVAIASVMKRRAAAKEKT